MTFNAAIPQPNDILSQSQAQIQTNFSQADLIFDINHVTFDNASVASRGKHRKVDYIRVGAPGSIAAEAVVYQKLAAGSSNLFMQRDGVATEVQLTGPNPINASNGETFLPGGILMKWGTATANGSASFTFIGDFALTDFPNNCFQVIATARNSGTPATANDYIYTHTPLVSGFSAIGTRRITLQATPVTFYWVAIGN